MAALAAGQEEKALTTTPPARKPCMPATHRNNFPKLHNAAWPGVVGKGSAGAEPFIDLDTMLDLTAAAEVDGVKFDGIDLFLFDPHVDIDSTDDDLKTLADKVHVARAGDRLRRRPGLAADRRRLGDGQRGRAQQFLEQVRKGCRIAQDAPRAGRAALRRRPHRLGLRAGRLARRTPRATRSASPTPSARPATSPPTTASGWRPRGKSAGAACTVGDGWCSFWS